MTDIDMSTGSTTDYLVALIVFWTVIVVGGLVIYRYVWPAAERTYKASAEWVHYAICIYRDSLRTTKERKS